MSSATNCSSRRDHAQLSSSPHHHPAPLPKTMIGPYKPILVNKAPCPALNALCNHGAYGMPRDGQNVHAFTLANALIKVYGLNYYFAHFLACGAILGINKNINKKFSLTLDFDELCDAPVAHWAALVHVNPTRRRPRTEGGPSHFLVKEMMEEAGESDVFTLKAFATWRNKREQQAALEMPHAQKYIAAGELALLLQVFGDPHNDYAVPRDVLRNFLEKERLPNEWLSERQGPMPSIGLASTFHVGHRVRRAMAKVRCRHYTPYYVYAAMLLCAFAGTFVILSKHTF